jgi:hypothetical protein
MVLEYLPTCARTKSPSFVGKYTSTMVRINPNHPQKDANNKIMITTFGASCS